MVNAPPSSAWCSVITCPGGVRCALRGGSLTLYQQPVRTACAFDVFVWKPEAPPASEMLALPTGTEATSNVAALALANTQKHASRRLEDESKKAAAACNSSAMSIRAGGSVMMMSGGSILLERKCEFVASAVSQSAPPSPPSDADSTAVVVVSVASGVVVLGGAAVVILFVCGILRCRTPGGPKKNALGAAQSPATMEKHVGLPFIGRPFESSNAYTRVQFTNV